VARTDEYLSDLQELLGKRSLPTDCASERAGPVPAGRRPKVKLEQADDRQITRRSAEEMALKQGDSVQAS
jgi:hypothetical protein